ncbi:hypothetical protein [Streptomyces sp. NPDC019890]|uniref:hypothetical protein n=1 Tax=Streptomyces sp. NPDC019890 TaxID=3365064 RepID=UPI00384AEBBA
MTRYAGTAAAVVGHADGIGPALARRLAEGGADVVRTRGFRHLAGRVREFSRELVGAAAATATASPSPCDPSPSATQQIRSTAP